MKKMKAATLVVSLVMFLSAFSALGPRFGYYLASSGVARVGTPQTVNNSCLFGSCDRPASGIGQGSVAQANIASNGLDRLLGRLVANVSLGLAAF